MNDKQRAELLCMAWNMWVMPMPWKQVSVYRHVYGESERDVYLVKSPAYVHDGRAVVMLENCGLAPLTELEFRSANS